MGTVEPVIVLADTHSADPLAGPVFTVSAVLYDGLEGKFLQTSQGYVGRSQARRVAGKRALFTPSGTRPDGYHVPIDLVVDEGNGWAVRVWGTKASETDLVHVAERASLDGHHLPVVAQPPGGLMTVARLNADQAAAATGIGLCSSSKPVPGPPSGYTVAFADPQATPGHTNSVIFVSLPGSASDPLAVMLLHHAAGESSESIAVNRKPAWRITHTYDAVDAIDRSVVFVGPAGNLFLITASGSKARTPDFTALERMAAGVHPATPTEWQALMKRVPH